jgi:hypothetical protein
MKDAGKRARKSNTDPDGVADGRDMPGIVCCKMIAVKRHYGFAE